MAKRNGIKWLAMVVVAILALSGLASAQVVKKAQGGLDDLKTSNPRTWISSTVQTLDSIRAELISSRAALGGRDRAALIRFQEVASGFDRFVAENGAAWQVQMDRRTGLPALIEGSGVPFQPRLPGDGRALLPAMERLARTFLADHADLFPVDGADLSLVPEGSGEFGGYLYYMRFQYSRGGVPVEGADVVFRINHGNLIQFGAENVAPQAEVDTFPSFDRQTALQILDGFVGGLSAEDEILDAGHLSILPIAPAGDTGSFAGTPGRGLEYALVYTLSFRRPGVMGSWTAKIDAHTGEVLSFADTNQYGSVTGGIYANSNLDAEAVRPLPFLTVSGVNATQGGVYSQTSGTVSASLAGKYVKVTDSCGTSSLSATAPADLVFGKSSGTDCTTPGVGGAGNSHAARSTYYHVTNWKLKAAGWLPSNTWLQGQLQDNVNLNQTCNAYWNGSSVNFFKSGGGCSNTGELPTVFLHESGHGLDSNDGGPSSENGSGEAYADTCAILQTHQSCVGVNFIPGQQCSGYGNACTACTGIRDADYTKHANSTTPAKASQLNAASGYHCPTSTSYRGPCGYEGHCEAYIMAEVTWDLAATDLPAQGVDANTSWLIVDRLFYLSRATSGSAYACPSLTTTNGCGTSNWFSTFRAVDDDNGNLSDGTPHAAAIYAAFNRHGIACTTVTNTNSSACPAIGQPTLTATAGNNSVNLSWGAVTNAAKYLVLRNEMSASAGMTIVAQPTATSYSDTGLANGITYYYSVQAVGSNGACYGAMATVKSATPTAGATYSISGTVSGATASGVTVSTAGASATTDASGNYTLSGLTNGTYTVTPTKTGFTFSPASLSVTISGASVTGKNFTATAVGGGDVALTSGVGVSGSVALNAYNYYTIAVPAGATNLSVTLTGLSADVDLYVNNSTTHPTTSAYYGRSWNSGTTNESLSYANPTATTWSIAAYGYAAGSYTVTATVTAGSATYSISGTITSGGAGLSGVTVSTTGASATTNTAGSYTLSGLANGTYTVTPAKSGYTFTPASLSVTISGASQTGKNFTATASGGTTTQVFNNAGFESAYSASDWTATYIGTSHVFRTTTTVPVGPHAGSYKTSLGAYNGTYYHNQTDTIYQTVAIPATTSSATLSFWYYIVTQETTASTAYDKLTITVESTGGTVLATPLVLSNLNKTAAWTQKTGLDLSAYKGQTVVIKFKVTTDSSLGTGFMLDDMALNVTTTALRPAGAGGAAK